MANPEALYDDPGYSAAGANQPTPLAMATTGRLPPRQWLANSEQLGQQLSLAAPAVRRSLILTNRKQVTQTTNLQQFHTMHQQQQQQLHQQSPRPQSMQLTNGLHLGRMSMESGDLLESDSAGMSTTIAAQNDLNGLGDTRALANNS